MLATLIASLVTTTAAAAPAVLDLPQPTLVPSPIQRVFVPEGFDDNDNVEIILQGFFPNTCYKTGPASAQVDTAAKAILAVAQSYKYDQTSCAQLEIPFLQVVSLGITSTGSYKITVKDQAAVTARPLSIGTAQSPNPDDFLYAPVESANLDFTAATEDSVHLEGSFPFMFTGCMQITDVRTKVTADNVVVVQPIAAIKPDSECQGVTHDFAVDKSLGSKLPAGAYLLHVRTLNGNAYNRFVQKVEAN